MGDGEFSAHQLTIANSVKISFGILKLKKNILINLLPGGL